jgi:hypothetical protein
MTPHRLQDTVSLLERTPAALDALLRSLPDVWTRRNEGGATWNAVEIVVHLIHAEEADWIPRARMIVEAGDSRPFPPFDRAAGLETAGERTMAEVLDAFAAARGASLAQLRALQLQEADLERRGLHPSLGGVTLSQLLATWAAHDLSHLHQIARVMAHQYRTLVGPWEAYLGVLQCAGHSAP